MGQLTLEDLKRMAPGVFASGGIAGRTRWVAVRGSIHDWAIYVGTGSDQEIADHGDKLFQKTMIRRLVDCTDEAFEWYRY